MFHIGQTNTGHPGTTIKVYLPFFIPIGFHRLKMVLQEILFAIRFFQEQPLAASSSRWFSWFYSNFCMFSFPYIIYVEHHSTIPKVCEIYIDVFQKLSSYIILTTCEFHRAPKRCGSLFQGGRRHVPVTLALLAWWILFLRCSRPQNTMTCDLSVFFFGEKASFTSNKSRTCHPKLPDV